MSLFDKYKDESLVKKILDEIKKFDQGVKIMEVCGTHTRAIFESGLQDLLPENITLISGPGCPICVTPQNYIDNAIELAKRKGIIIATFADLLKIPGTFTSLQEMKAKGSNIRVVSSPLDAVKIAERNPDYDVVFLAVGFETTTPVIALSILEADRLKLNNYSLLLSLKIMPPVIEELIMDKELAVDAFICPGHVSTIIGSEPFNFIADSYNLPAVIAGFERVDIILALARILDMIKNKRAQMDNLYTRAVRIYGNQKAKAVINKVFKIVDSNWRGLSKIKKSGLSLKNNYKRFDVVKKLNLNLKPYCQDSFCSCGDIIKGKKIPLDCQLFAKTCNPLNPKGPCMVSEEGNCNIYYEYRR